MKTQELSKYDDILFKLENLRFYIKTEDQASKALIFTKRLREFADFVEEKVKARASELMSDNDKHTLEFEGWTIKRVEPTTRVSYLATNVIEALGIDRAMPFLKVDNVQLKFYMIKQGMTQEEIGIATRGKKERPIRGYIKIIENKKNDKD